MPQDQDVNSVEKALRAELSNIESRLLARRGKRDSRWLAIGTVSILVMLSLVALVGALLTQPGMFDLMQVWLTGTPQTSLNSETGMAELGEAAPRNVGSNPYAFTQFMTLFLAISAGGIAYLASAMGMKRLERYDEQFQAFREESQESDDRIEKRFEKNRDELTQTLNGLARKEFDKLQLESQTKFNEQSEAARAELNEIVQEITKVSDEVEKKFGVIVDNASIDTVLIDNPSIGEIHRKVTSYFAQGEPAKARELTRAVLNVRDATTGRLTTTGDLNDWFNLSSVLGRSDEFLLGLQVTLAGLAQQNLFSIDVVDTLQLTDHASDLSPNVDLLSHAIQYGDKIGQTELVEKLVAIAEAMREEARNWRYYQFLGDHYAEQDNKAGFDRIVDEFRRRLPADERSDSLELSWHQERQNDAEIDRIAMDWLPPSTKRGSAVPLRLSTIYMDRGDYDKVLQLTSRALEGSSESQPNGNIGAMIFYRGNAHDALFIRAAQEQPVDCKKMEKHFTNACRLYRSDLFDGVSQIMRTAADRRIKAMTLLFQETDCRLPDNPNTGSLPNGSDPVKSGNVPQDLKAAGEMIDQAIRAAVDGDMETYESMAQKIESLEGITRKVIHASLIAAAEDDDHSAEVQNAARNLAKRLHDVS